VPYYPPAAVAFHLPTLYIENMGLQYVSASSVKIAPGSCRDSADSYDIVVSADITLSLAASGVNGLDTGSETIDTPYAGFVIADSTGVNPVRGVLSINSTTPTLPAGYDVYRRVGWCQNDGSSNIIQYNLIITSMQTREVRYDVDEQVTEVLTGGTSSGAYSTVDLSGLCPPTSRNADLLISYDGTIDGEHVRVRWVGSAVAIPPTRVFAGGTGGRERVGTTHRVRISSSQTVEYQNSTAGNTAYIWCLGYVDVLSA
jgi:hypothetical protein